MDPRVFCQTGHLDVLYVQWSNRGPYRVLREQDGEERFTLPPEMFEVTRPLDCTCNEEDAA